MTPRVPHARRQLKALREEAADCRAWPLWKDATQAVFGEGPQNASHFKFVRRGKIRLRRPFVARI